MVNVLFKSIFYKFHVIGHIMYFAFNNKNTVRDCDPGPPMFFSNWAQPVQTGENVMLKMLNSL